MLSTLISLASHHTFALPASCQKLRQLNTERHVQQFCDESLACSPFWILGEGSNCAFIDDYSGQVVKITTTGKSIEETPSHWKVRVAAGENWHELVHWCMKKGLYGLENLALIPGTVGAAPIQNIGAYGVELANVLGSVSFVELGSGISHQLGAHECALGYRDSIFKRELAGKIIITQVCLTLPKQWKPTANYGELKKLTNPSAEDIYNKVMAVRHNKLPDPQTLGNAGSFFKNPVISSCQYQKLQQHWLDIPGYPLANNKTKVPAAWLIEQAGFKGVRYGGIGCHAKQPLVLINLGSGQGQELLYLAREIKDRVFDQFAIGLQNEVNLIGKDGKVDL